MRNGATSKQQFETDILSSDDEAKTRQLYRANNTAKLAKSLAAHTASNVASTVAGDIGNAAPSSLDLRSLETIWTRERDILKDDVQSRRQDQLLDGGRLEQQPQSPLAIHLPVNDSVSQSLAVGSSFEDSRNGNLVADFNDPWLQEIQRPTPFIDFPTYAETQRTPGFDGILDSGSDFKVGEAFKRFSNADILSSSDEESSTRKSRPPQLPLLQVDQLATDRLYQEASKSGQGPSTYQGSRSFDQTSPLALSRGVVSSNDALRESRPLLTLSELSGADDEASRSRRNATLSTTTAARVAARAAAALQVSSVKAISTINEETQSLIKIRQILSECGAEVDGTSQDAANVTVTKARAASSSEEKVKSTDTFENVASTTVTVPRSASTSEKKEDPTDTFENTESSNVTVRGTAQASEKKVDPLDGELCTYQELLDRYRGVYSEEQSQSYWDNKCISAPQSRTLKTAAAQPPELKGILKKSSRRVAAPPENNSQTESSNQQTSDAQNHLQLVNDGAPQSRKALQRARLRTATATQAFKKNTSLDEPLKRTLSGDHVSEEIEQRSAPNIESATESVQGDVQVQSAPKAAAESARPSNTVSDSTTATHNHSQPDNDGGPQSRKALQRARLRTATATQGFKKHTPPDDSFEHTFSGDQVSEEHEQRNVTNSEVAAEGAKGDVKVQSVASLAAENPKGAVKVQNVPKLAAQSAKGDVKVQSVPKLANVIVSIVDKSVNQARSLVEMHEEQNVIAKSISLCCATCVLQASPTSNETQSELSNLIRAQSKLDQSIDSTRDELIKAAVRLEAGASEEDNACDATRSISDEEQRARIAVWAREAASKGEALSPSGLARGPIDANEMSAKRLGLALKQLSTALGIATSADQSLNDVGEEDWWVQLYRLKDFVEVNKRYPLAIDDSREAVLVKWLEAQRLNALSDVQRRSLESLVARSPELHAVLQKERIEHQESNAQSHLRSDNDGVPQGKKALQRAKIRATTARQGFGFKAETSLDDRASSGRVPLDAAPPNTVSDSTTARHGFGLKAESSLDDGLSSVQIPPSAAPPNTASDFEIRSGLESSEHAHSGDYVSADRGQRVIANNELVTESAARAEQEVLKSLDRTNDELSVQINKQSDQLHELETQVKELQSLASAAYGSTAESDASIDLHQNARLPRTVLPVGVPVHTLQASVVGKRNKPGLLIDPTQHPRDEELLQAFEVIAESTRAIDHLRGEERQLDTAKVEIEAQETTGSNAHRVDVLRKLNRARSKVEVQLRWHGNEIEYAAIRAKELQPKSSFDEKGEQSKTATSKDIDISLLGREEQLLAELGQLEAAKVELQAQAATRMGSTEEHDAILKKIDQARSQVLANLKNQLREDAGERQAPAFVSLDDESGHLSTAQDALPPDRLDDVLDDEDFLLALGDLADELQSGVADDRLDAGKTQAADFLAPQENAQDSSHADKKIIEVPKQAKDPQENVENSTRVDKKIVEIKKHPKTLEESVENGPRVEKKTVDIKKQAKAVEESAQVRPRLDEEIYEVRKQAKALEDLRREDKEIQDEQAKLESEIEIRVLTGGNALRKARMKKLTQQREKIALSIANTEEELAKSEAAVNESEVVKQEQAASGSRPKVLDQGDFI